MARVSGVVSSVVAFQNLQDPIEEWLLVDTGQGRVGWTPAHFEALAGPAIPIGATDARARSPARHQIRDLGHQGWNQAWNAVPRFDCVLGLRQPDCRL